MKRSIVLTLSLGLSALLGVALLTAQAGETSKPKADEDSVERARKMVRMLDDIYKSTVVLITDKYVHEEDDYPAGSAVIELFGQITKKGSHTVELLDATGAPYDEENVADDAFEKTGIKKLKAGQDYYEEIVTKDGKPVLRAITAVPVVMKKCILCHPHYEDAKKGEAIGAISYAIPIE